jgi:hypothetical protein
LSGTEREDPNEVTPARIVATIWASGKTSASCFILRKPHLPIATRCVDNLFVRKSLSKTHQVERDSFCQTGHRTPQSIVHSVRALFAHGITRFSLAVGIRCPIQARQTSKFVQRTIEKCDNVRNRDTPERIQSPLGGARYRVRTCHPYRVTAKRPPDTFARLVL